MELNQIDSTKPLAVPLQERHNCHTMEEIVRRTGELRLGQNGHPRPTVHQIEVAPKCGDCAKAGKRFFDFDCLNCEALVADGRTSIAQLMAIARQWSHCVQSKMNVLVSEMLRRGAHADDRDALTDMTMLHFVCKSGAPGMGNGEAAMKMAEFLIERAGANVTLRCRWNDMNALHFAAYYDVAPVVGYLVSVVPRQLIDQPSPYLDSKTALHIAATNLSLKSAKVLLGADANGMLKDKLGRTPLDCIPNDQQLEDNFTWNNKIYRGIALEMRAILEATTLTIPEDEISHSATDLETFKTAKLVLSVLGFEIGDRVIVGNAKVGILRYCGPTQFASGIWTGIELDDPIGKHDGTIDGIPYFICPPKHGIFAPLNKISKLDFDDYDLLKSSTSCPRSNGTPNSRWHHTFSSTGLDLSTVQSKIDSGLNRPNRFSDVNGILSSSTSSINSEDVHVGSRVFLTDRKTGIVRFIGMTQFSPGIWYGIELSRPLGKNDGIVQGVRYFQCPPACGVFIQFYRIARLLPEHTRKTISTSLASGNPDESDETGSDMTSGTSSLDIAITQSLTNGHHHDRRSLVVLSKPAPIPNSRMVTSSSNISASTSNFRRTMSLRRPPMRSTSRVALESVTRKDESWLRIGVNGLVNGMVACVRFIGTVHFTEGVFLGVELRTPNGKNDGSIDGIRYFTCKPNFGLLVRPNKVTVRGINASKLLPEEFLSNGNIGKSKEI